MRQNLHHVRQAPSVQPQPSEDTDRRARTRNPFALILLALIVIVLESVIVAWLSVETIRTKRLQQGRDRSLATVQLNALLIDAQWSNAVSLLKVECQRDGLIEAVRANSARRVRVSLQNSMRQNRDLLVAAAYYADGRQLACCPASPIAPSNAMGTLWFHALASGQPFSIGPVTRQPGSTGRDSIALAIPVGRGPRPEALLLTYFARSMVESWLKPTRGGDLDICVLDARGQVVVSSGAPPPHALLEGALQTPTLRFRDWASTDEIKVGSAEIIVGRATARTPNWRVIAIQNVAALIGPTDQLVRILVIPSLMLIAGAAWTLASLYRRQEAMAAMLARQNERLRGTDEAREEFMAHVSHDLRTPLTNMQLAISELQESDRDWDPDRVRDSLHAVSEDIDRINGRVRNLLEMSRLDANAWPALMEPHDLTDIAAAALERLQPLLRDRPILTEFPDEPMLVDCDQAQIETVIINLLENAVKYSPSGSPLRLHGELCTDTALFALYDQGSGVEPGDEARVFEKYYRAPSVAAAGGTGLGLSICKSVVEAHGGAIGVRRPSGGGAEFWFTLPVLHLSENALA